MTMGALSVKTTLRLGEVLSGRYRLLELLGEGGMGAVYEAEDLKLGHPVAVKLLGAQHASSTSACQRFLREVATTARLQSPHVVKIFDAGSTTDGVPYFVMELLSGLTLRELLEEHGKLPISRAVNLAISLGLALEQAHAQGVIHRDLKPGNLFLETLSDGTDFVRLLDFGVAKLSDLDATGITATGATLGTASYMPPEQARGSHELDCRADVYALGAILYEMCSGHKPHPGDSYNAVIFHILNQPVIPLSTLRPESSPELTAIVARALATDPEDRFCSASAFASALRGCSGATAPRPRELTTMEMGPEVARPARRRSRVAVPWLWVGGLLGAFGIGLWLGARPRVAPKAAERTVAVLSATPVGVPRPSAVVPKEMPTPVVSAAPVSAPVVEERTKNRRLAAAPPPASPKVSPRGFRRTNPFE